MTTIANDRAGLLESVAAYLLEVYTGPDAVMPDDRSFERETYSPHFAEPVAFAAALADTTQSSTCPHCGHMVSFGEVYCLWCGSPLFDKQPVEANGETSTDGLVSAENRSDESNLIAHDESTRNETPGNIPAEHADAHEENLLDFVEPVAFGAALADTVDQAFCPKCGHAVTFGYQFCMNCGRRLASGSRAQEITDIDAYSLDSQVARPTASLLHDWIDTIDEPFSITLLKLIDERGADDEQVCKRANISLKRFAQIRNNAYYRPTKRTVFALAIALELNLEETTDLLDRANLELSHDIKSDVIIEYFITHGIYDMFTINGALYEFDQPML